MSQIVLADLRYLMILSDWKPLVRLEPKDQKLIGRLRQRSHNMDAIVTEVAARQRRLEDAEHDHEDSQKILKITRQDVQDTCRSVAEGM
jgi:hypothetical protein